MVITKLGHSCVRLEHAGRVLVVDPGGWTERDAVDGATAVLVTHEHPDHLSVDHLRATDAPVFTISAVADQIRAADPAVAERVTVVGPGESFDAGLPVTAVGEQHAVIHPAIARISNSGYVVTAGETRVYHPGDALTPPDRPVDVLFLPIHAPWNKFSEVAEFAKQVNAPRSIAVHDGLLNDTGLALLERLLSGMLGEQELSYERLAPGQGTSA
jgi:L-ascorbate metabolism protein UlaG (beta-lactamase superfamily)